MGPGRLNRVHVVYRRLLPPEPSSSAFCVKGGAAEECQDLFIVSCARPRWPTLGIVQWLGGSLESPLHLRGLVSGTQLQCTEESAVYHCVLHVALSGGALCTEEA